MTMTGSSGLLKRESQLRAQDDSYSFGSGYESAGEADGITAEDRRAPDGLCWWPWGPWRGSSQAVRVGDHWLWVDHRMIEDVSHLGNVYVHRFVLADSKLQKIVSTSRPFVFKGYGVEFCAGLALDGSNAVLSYSSRDANALLAIVSLESVLSAARAN